MRLSLLCVGLAFAFATSSYSPTITANEMANPIAGSCAEVSCEKEMRQLLRLARGGSGDAAAIVGMAYASGDGLEQNDKEAERYMRIGVRYNSPVAMYILSDWYLNGHIVEQDVEESVRLLDLAIRGEYAPALYKRALQLIRINEPETIAEGVELLEQAADKNLVSAMFALARLKHTGVGVEQDLYGAAELYRQLIMAGHTDSRHHARQISRELAQLDGETDNDEVIARLLEAEGMERISVVGSQMNVHGRLGNLAKRLAATGRYDSRSIGSRIRGVSCEDTGTNCGSSRPEAGQSSLNEVLTGVVE